MRWHRRYRRGMARLLILRDRNRARRWMRGRGALSLAVFAAISSCVMPLAASRPAASSLTVALDAPTPMAGPEDLAAALGIGDPAGGIAASTLAFPNAADPSHMSREEQVPFVAPAQFDAGPAAAPYVFRGRTSTDSLRAMMCLTAAIYYEAANEPDDGQRAVAQVVINRVRHPAFPNSVCDVVYQGTERNDTLCQFTFGCDGALARRPAAAQWARARRVAAAALSGSVFVPVGLATNYHTLAVSPAWGPRLVPTGIFGAHIFYRLPGGVGAPRAFASAYSGREPIPGPRPKLNPPQTPSVVMAEALISAPVLPAAGTAVPTAAPRPEQTVAGDRRYVPGALPESEVNPAYRDSGQWIARP